MSYPRVSHTTSTSKPRTGNNLKSLLVNKFRGKFASTKGLGEDVIENLIQSSVDQFMRNSKMTEVNLIKLDKVITD